MEELKFLILMDDGDVSEIERAQKLLEITNSLFFEPHEDPVKAIAGAVEVRTTKYHELLNFYKLAGKTYETYVYAYPYQFSGVVQRSIVVKIKKHTVIL